VICHQRYLGRGPAAAGSGRGRQSGADARPGSIAPDRGFRLRPTPLVMVGNPSSAALINSRAPSACPSTVVRNSMSACAARASWTRMGVSGPGGRRSPHLTANPSRRSARGHATERRSVALMPLCSSIRPRPVTGRSTSPTSAACLRRAPVSKPSLKGSYGNGWPNFRTSIAG